MDGELEGSECSIWKGICEARIEGFPMFHRRRLVFLMRKSRVLMLIVYSSCNVQDPEPSHKQASPRSLVAPEQESMVAQYHVGKGLARKLRPAMF